MQTIIFHSNILSKGDVPFINALEFSLKNRNLELVLTGWNGVPNDWDLSPQYFKLPSDIHSFKQIYDPTFIYHEFKEYGLSVDWLLERFTWWFPESRNQSQRNNRLAFLHYHLHHYLELLKQYSPSLLMIWNGNDPRHCILKALGETHDIGMVFMERGPIPSVLFYDVQGVLSHSTIASLPISKLKNADDNPKFLKQYEKWYSNSSETLWEQPKLDNLCLRERFEINPRQKITLFIGQVDNDIQTKLFSPYFSTNVDAFEWFMENARDNNHFVIGKHHPKSTLPVHIYQSKLKDYDNVVWTDEIALDDFLPQIDNVVAVNSSVIFDALFYKKPVLTLGKTMLDGKGILFECNPEDFKNVLQAFYNSEGFATKLKNFNTLLGYMFTNNFLFTKDFAYAEKYAKFLDSIKKDMAISVKPESSKNIIKDYEYSARKKGQKLTLLEKGKRKVKLVVNKLVKIVKL